MLRTALALIAFALLSAPAAAQYVQWEGKWVAIAYGGPDLATGTAVDYPSADAARQAALNACGGRCSGTFALVKAYAAVAESRTATQGFAINCWRDRAIVRPLAACARTGSDCTLLTVA